MMKIRRLKKHFFIALLGYLILCAGVGWLFLATFQGMLYGKPQPPDICHECQGGISLEGLSGEGSEPKIDVIIGVTPPGFSDNVMSKVTTKSLFLVIPNDTQADEICLKSLVYAAYISRNQYSNNDNSVIKSAFPKGQENCIFLQTNAGSYIKTDQGDIYIINLDPEIYNAELSPSLYDYMFPYDEFKLQINLMANIALLYKGNTIFTWSNQRLPIYFSSDPLLSADSIRFSGWEFGVSRWPSTEIGSFDPNYFLQINFERPLLIRIIIPVIFVMIFILIVSLLFSSSLDTFISGTVGVFFGLFGIKNFVDTPQMHSSGLIKKLILFMFLLLIFAFVAFLIRKIIQKNISKPPEEKQPRNIHYKRNIKSRN